MRLIPPVYVRPFVRRQKNDAADAEAFCEAAQRPTMRFVLVKSEETQAAVMVFRVRELLIRQRTQACRCGAVAGQSGHAGHERPRLAAHSALSSRDAQVVVSKRQRSARERSSPALRDLHAPRHLRTANGRKMQASLLPGSVAPKGPCPGGSLVRVQERTAPIDRIVWRSIKHLGAGFRDRLLIHMASVPPWALAG